MDVVTALKEILMFVGIVSGCSMIYALFTYVKIKVNNSKLNDAIDIVLDSVDKISQVYVDTLKKEGKFNKDAQAKALEKAIFEARNLMSDSVYKFIEKNYGDVDKWIISKIESYIKRQHPDVVVPLTSKPLLND